MGLELVGHIVGERGQRWKKGVGLKGVVEEKADARGIPPGDHSGRSWGVVGGGGVDNTPSSQQQRQ